MRRNPNRSFDPHQQVTRSLEDRRGFVNQASIQETQKAVKRLGGLGENPTNFPDGIDVFRELTLDGDEIIRWPVGIGYDESRLVIRGVGEGIEQDYFKFWYSGGAAEFKATNLYNGTDEFFIVRSSTTFNSPYVLMRGPAMFYFRNAADADTMSIDPETGNIVTPGGITAASSNRWESGAHADAGAATISAVGMPAWTVPAGASNDGSTGAYIAFTTTAVSGNATGPNGPLSYRTDWGVDCTFHINIVDTANVRIHVGLYASDPSGLSSPTVNMAGFRYDSSLGPDWGGRTADGAAGATSGTGVALAVGSVYLRMVLSASSAAFYINGVLVVTRTTNLPTSSAPLAPYVRITTMTAATKAIRFGYFNALSQ